MKHEPRSSLGEAALRLAKHRLRVFPLIAKGKAPATPHGCKDATTDPKVTRAWWSQNPACNIAIATGNGIGVADTDGPDGEAWLVEQGDLPSTWTSLTARGMHRYYAIPLGLRSRTGFGPHVDFKAESGYVVAPPSIHPDGPRYRWKKGQAPWEIPLAPIPPWLLERVQGPRSVIANDNAVLYDGVGFLALARDGVAEGNRNNSVASLAGRLLRSHVDPFLALELILAWNEARNQPPLPVKEVCRTVDSIARLELERRREGAQ